MKKALPVLTLAALAATGFAAQAATSVGISISVMQPGVYGRIDLGDAAPPPVYGPPVVYRPVPVAVHRRPIYLYVPPGHQKNWGKYCGRYAACDQPVYFVTEAWVRERYDERGPGPDDRGHDHDHDRGRGHGRGHGHGHDH